MVSLNQDTQNLIISVRFPCKGVQRAVRYGSMKSRRQVRVILEKSEQRGS